MNNFLKYLSKSLLATAVLLAGATPAWAQVSLGDASDFSVLAASVTCTTSAIVGDVGIAPPTAFTNTGCTITGAMPPATNTAALAARADFLSAYADMQLLTSSCIPVSGNLSGVDLAPGVYCLDAVAKAGTLTLTGPANGEWIFLVNGALTGTNFTVVMAGGAEACNVYWAPSAAVTMSTSSFKGNILAGNAIDGAVTLTGGTLAGSVLANVAVTMTNASIVGCDALSPLPPSCKPKKHHDKHHGHDKDHKKCNQGVGNGSEGCDPGKSNHHNSSNDENGGKPGKPGRQGK